MKKTHNRRLRPWAVALAAVAAAMLLFLALSLFGWRLLGFGACQGAGIESVTVDDGQVEIEGFYPGSFPQGFLGYHAEERDGTLYVGFRFSPLAVFSTGDFHICIPTRGQISRVCIQARENEYPIWPGEAEETP